MADDTPDAPADTADPPEPTPEPPETPEGDKDTTPPDTDKWKGLARKHEREAKGLLQKLKEYEDRDKSEVEKLTDRLSTAERRALDADRLEIALDKGLTKSQAKRLVGSTREELEADADELLADLGVEDAKPSPSRRPQERLRPGAAPDAEPVKSPAEMADAVIRQRGF